MRGSLPSLLLVLLTLSPAAEARDVPPRHRIGLVFDASGRGDRCLNDLAFEGLVEVAKNFNGYFTTPADPRHGNELEIKYLVAADDSRSARLHALDQLGREGYSLVFALGFLFSEVVPQAARAHPGTHYVLIDGHVPDLGPRDNLTVVEFREHEGSFLVGVLAGHKAGDGKIGFLGGMDIALVQRFEAGFRAGAAWANPRFRDASRVLVRYLGNDPSAFDAPDRAYRLALQMYREGATVIYHAAGRSGLGLFRAAQEARRWAIGVNADQGSLLNFDRDPNLQEQARWILTSMLKRVNRPIFLLTRDFLRKGRIEPRHQTLGLNFDAVGVAVNPLNRDVLGAALIQQVSDTRVRIANGHIVVPSTREELLAWSGN